MGLAFLQPDALACNILVARTLLKVTDSVCVVLLLRFILQPHLMITQYHPTKIDGSTTCHRNGFRKRSASYQKGYHVNGAPYLHGTLQLLAIYSSSGF